MLESCSAVTSELADQSYMMVSCCCGVLFEDWSYVVSSTVAVLRSVKGLSKNWCHSLSNILLSKPENKLLSNDLKLKPLSNMLLSKPENKLLSNDVKLKSKGLKPAAAPVSSSIFAVHFRGTS
jgi:hypothetical protein